jgi:drug/metabolite transporter (DMT)-like permease
MSRSAILFLVMCLVWGLTWIPSKIAMEHSPPMLFAAVRYCIAAPLILAMAYARGGIAIRGSLGRLLISALLVNTGCYALLFWGVARAPTGIAAIVNMASMPLLTILLGRLHGDETIDARKLAAIALGAVGLILLYANRLPGVSGTSEEEALGLAAVLGASVSYCWGAVLSRPLTLVMSPVALAGWQSTIGALTLLVLSLVFEGTGLAELEEIARWPTNICLAYMIVGGTLLGYLIFLRLLRDWGPFRAGLYAFVSPVVAAVAGVIFMQETFGWPEMIGGLVMFASAGLAITARRPAAAIAQARAAPPPREG